MSDRALAIIDLVDGGTPQFLTTEYLRELTEADLALLENDVLGVVTPPLAKLREVHHHLARLLAEGRRPVECASIMGYSQSRISILKKDPAFSELVAYYKGQITPAYQSIHEKLAQVGGMAVEELRDKIEEDKLSNGQLIEVAKMALDRSVAPPKGGSGTSGGGGAIPALTIQFVTPQAAVPLQATDSSITIEGAPLEPQAPASIPPSVPEDS